MPCQEFCENPPHDRRLGGFDRAQATLRLAVRTQTVDRLVAIGNGADAPALPDPSLQAAPGPGREVLEIQRAHGAGEGDLQIADLAFGQRDNPGSGKPGLLVEGGDMLRIARQAVQALGQDEVDLATPQCGQQGLIGRTLHDRAGERVVGIDLTDGPTLTLRAHPADPHLIVDRGIALHVGTEAGIDHGTRHEWMLLTWRHPILAPGAPPWQADSLWVELRARRRWLSQSVHLS